MKQDSALIAISFALDSLRPRTKTRTVWSANWHPTESN